MSDRIEVNQPIRIIIECIVNGETVDLTSGYSAYAIEYQSPNGTPTKVTATVLNPPGADGKIYYDVPESIFSDPRKWKAKPWLTTDAGDEFPGAPVDLEIRREWEI